MCLVEKYIETQILYTAYVYIYIYICICMRTTQLVKANSSSRFLQAGLSDIGLCEISPILSFSGRQRPSSQSLAFSTESTCERLPSASQGLKAASLQPDRQTEKQCQTQILFLVD